MTRLMSVFILLLAFAGATGAQVSPTVPTSPQEISLSFAPVVKKAAPAVVNIYAKRVTQGRQTPFMNDPFFDQFFRGFDAPRPRVQSSLGSGVMCLCSCERTAVGEQVRRT